MPPEQHASPRVVWVTGASSGIGMATAHACARRGDRLVLSSRAQAPLEEVARQCRALGAADVVVAPLDIADDGAVRRAAADAVRRWGRLDVVVQNAGVAAYGRVDEVPPEVLEGVLRTNVLGAAFVAAEAVRTFRAQGEGTLVVVGSVLGRVTVPWMGAYNATKFALRGLVRTMQQENRDVPGIRISLVAPGGVDTPIYDQSATVLGRRNRPPYPVSSPEHVAEKVLRAADRSAPAHRELDAGWANPAMKAAYALAPGLFDLLSRPAMRALGFARGQRPVGPGNVLSPQPHEEGLRQRR
ncbi:SDR family NAD(P)-dependent oxidoreductase [Quadrisphaera sp. KR29]|uniref:SDR family NAD(P)-dependent oxidoreductase n=1 Tax=Quadrisphaera sp. KR29 TaxID=3461391 RepID=UPI0040445755